MDKSLFEFNILLQREQLFRFEHLKAYKMVVTTDFLSNAIGNTISNKGSVITQYVGWLIPYPYVLPY